MLPAKFHIDLYPNQSSANSFRHSWRVLDACSVTAFAAARAYVPSSSSVLGNGVNRKHKPSRNATHNTSTTLESLADYQGLVREEDHISAPVPLST